MKALYLAATLCTALASCASMNDAMTPSAVVLKDDFDGATIVRQPPVSASGGLGEDWHTLGFEWTQKTPDLVYITAGVRGIFAIESVAFNADGKVIEQQIRTASTATEFGTWSSRRFVMPWSDFLAVAGAKSVKMKVSRINEYTVSSFGPESPNAIVNTKFAPFIQQVSDLRSKLKK